MWGVNRRHKGAAQLLAALKSIRATRPDGALIYAVMVQEADLHGPGTRAGAQFTAGGEIGTARFDDRVEAVARVIAAEAPVVDHVRIGDEFDLQLTLSSGMSFEVFPAGREGREDRRLISSAGGRRHYVVENRSMYAV